MLLSMLAKNLFGIPRWIYIVILIGLLILAGVSIERRDDKNNQELGALVEKEKAAQGTIKQVEKANAVREEIKRNPNAAYAECVQSARTPANCERLLSE